MKAFCYSVNADEVGIILAGGGDTQPLSVVIKRFQLGGGGDPKTWYNRPLGPRGRGLAPPRSSQVASHLVKLSLPDLNLRLSYRALCGRSH